MHLATVLLFCCWSLAWDAPPSAVAPNTVSAAPASDSGPSSSSKSSLPEVPLPKSDSTAATEEITPGIVPSGDPFIVKGPAKPAGRGSYESSRDRKIWYGLVAASHSAAVFDAYTTRRAVSGHYGTESDPLLRPFANSNAMYFATQVSPLVMDYLGHRMMTSEHLWMRKIWWVPQVAGTSLSLGAGIHNYRIVP